MRLQPVFIEPRFEHAFLCGARYLWIVFFEALVALLLLRWFLGSELRAALSRRPRAPEDPLSQMVAGKRLACAGEQLMILGLRSGPQAALNLDGSEVRLPNCEAFLRGAGRADTDGAGEDTGTDAGAGADVGALLG